MFHTENGKKRIAFIAVTMLLWMLAVTPFAAYAKNDPPAPQKPQSGAAGDHRKPVKASEHSSLFVVADGQANATVLVSVYADNQTWEAADTLADYVHRSTGAVLPVMTDAAFAAGGNNDDGILIYVGLSAPGDDPGISQQLQGMDDDGFIIASKGNHVTIIGPSSWGTRFGVYEFLERYVGVMWLMPGEDGVDVPAHTDLAVPRNEYIKQEPAFKDRDLFHFGDAVNLPNPTTIGTEFAKTLRLHMGIQFMHNIYTLFPPAEFAVSHPEFYPIRNGIRYIPPAGVVTGWQPCYSEPGTVQAATYKIIQYFNDHPQERSFSLGINDGAGFCEMDPSSPYYNPTDINSAGSQDMSDIYFHWVNEVVEGVLAVHPDKQFGLYAYAAVQDPPSFAVNSHVTVFITKDRMAWLDADVKARDQALFQSWRAAADNVAWYDYMYGKVFTLPRVYPHLMADNLQYAAANDVAGFFAELSPSFGEGPKNWLLGKLLWNPDQDVDALQQMWYERAVGAEAAPYLKAYFDHWEAFWTERVTDTAWFERGFDRTFFPFTADYLEEVTAAEIAASRQLLETAAAKTETAQQLARVNVLLTHFAYYEASALSYPQHDDAPATEAEAKQQVDAVIDRLGWTEQRDNYIADHMYDYMTRIFSMTRPELPYLNWDGWNPYSFTNVVDYIKQHEPNGGPVTVYAATYADAAPSAGQRAAAYLLQAAKQDDAPQLQALENGSFEFGTTGAPGWTLTNINAGASMTRSEDVAHSGNASLLFSGNVGAGGPRQIVPVRPGLAHFKMWYYTPPGQTQTQGWVRLNLLLLDEAGSTLSSRISDVAYLQETDGEWAELQMLTEIPAEINGKAVKRALLIPFAAYIKPNEQLYIDDVEFKNISLQGSLVFPKLFWHTIDRMTQEEPAGGPITDSISEQALDEAASEARAYARLALSIAGGLPTSSLNASFENAANTQPWGYLAGNGGMMQRSTNEAHSGNASFYIKGAPINMPYQYITPKPGPVAARAYFKVPEGTATNGTIQLAYYLNDANNNWLQTIATTVQPIAAAEGEWASIDLHGIIPAAVNGVAVQRGQLRVILQGIESNTELYLDDINLYQMNLVNDPATFWHTVDILKTEPVGGPFHQMVTELAEDPAPSDQRDYAKLALSIAGGLPSSSLNASFENASTQPWGYLAGIGGSMQRSTAEAHSGSASLYIKGQPIYKPYQYITPKPGPVAARAYFKVPAGTVTNGTIQLAYYLNDANNSWLKTIATTAKPLALAEGEWASIELQGIVPAAVNGVAVQRGQFVVLLQGIESNTELYLDDVELYMLDQ